MTTEQPHDETEQAPQPAPGQPHPKVRLHKVRGGVLKTWRQIRRAISTHWTISGLAALVVVLAAVSVIATRPDPHLAVTPRISTTPADTLVARVANAQCGASGAQVLSASWLTQRVELTDLGIFASQADPENQLTAFTYYKVGTTSTGQTIVLIVTPQAIVGDYTAIAVENAPGHYIILARNSAGSAYKHGGQYSYDYTPNASVATYDVDKEFPDLCAPDTVTYKDASFSASGSTILQPSVSDGSAPVALQKYPYGTLYGYTYKSDPLYKMVYYELALPDTTYIHYDYHDPLDSPAPADITDAPKPPHIIWADGSANTNQYVTKFVGCGAGTVEIANNLHPADLRQIGTGPTDQPVYGFASVDNALFQIHYQDYLNDYRTSAQGDDPYVANFDKSLVNLSPSAWASYRPVLLVPDGLGNYEVLLSDQFVVGGGGCGKPVIYLYPTQPTIVSVKVGADIHLSKPTYDNGWQVFAQPSGKLLWNGQPYDSLFWEGFGNGFYPASNAGTVVAQRDVATTVTSQLVQLGLTAQERNDFLAFWLPRLPATPYVRLTWFNTAQMNQLAPLAISPKPTTLIRVFLDYQGLQHPIILPAQQLHATPRIGFTVVEWGGVLR